MSAKSAAQPPKPHRSTLMTVAIVLVILHGLFMTAFYYTTGQNLGGRADSPMALTILVLASVADVIAGVAMWYWKRWGIYLYLAATIAKVVVMLVYTGSLYAVFGGLIPTIIVLYIVYPHIKHFD